MSRIEITSLKNKVYDDFSIDTLEIILSSPDFLSISSEVSKILATDILLDIVDGELASTSSARDRATILVKDAYSILG